MAGSSAIVSCTSIEPLQPPIDHVRPAELVGDALGVDPDRVYLASTGVIGETLPEGALRNGGPANQEDGRGEKSNPAAAAQGATRRVLASAEPRRPPATAER